MVLVNFWRYPDPYQRFLIRIRIRIRPNDTDPTGSGSGSGSETLHDPSAYNTDIGYLTEERIKTILEPVQEPVVSMSVPCSIY